MLYESKEFQDYLKNKYDNYNYFINEGYHLDVGFDFLNIELLRLNEKKIKNHIMEKGNDYIPSDKHMLMPEYEEEYVYVRKHTRNTLIEFHKDVQKIIDKYSDAEYWAEKYIKEYKKL